MIRKSTILLFLATIGMCSYSQTPITNTNFYKAYQKDFYIISVAEREGIINDEIAEYLLSPKVSNDLKAAIINAMSFDIIEKENTQVFLTYLSGKYKIPKKEVVDSDSLTASEIMCIGYLLTMDDYFETEEAISLLKKAQKLDPADYSISLIYRLVESHQKYLDEPCDALVFFDYFPSKNIYTNYLLPEAEQIIFDYFNELKVKCN